MLNFPILVPSQLPTGVRPIPTIFVDSHDSSHSVTLIYGDTPAAPSGGRGTRLILQEFEGLAILPEGSDQRITRVNDTDVKVGTYQQPVGGVEFLVGWNRGNIAVQAAFEWLDSDRKVVTADQQAEALKVIASMIGSSR